MKLNSVKVQIYDKPGEKVSDNVATYLISDEIYRQLIYRVMLPVMFQTSDIFLDYIKDYMEENETD